MPQEAPSPFLRIPESEWHCANALCFAIFDSFPVSRGHVLVITRRLVPTFFECTQPEQAALMELVGEVKRLLDQQLDPKPDGYNVGFNTGTAAGQTVPHVHVHVIPRYTGDVGDPRGGVRHVIPGKGNYLAGPSDTSAGGAQAAADVVETCSTRCSPRTVRSAHGSWFTFCRAEGDLDASEERAPGRFGTWLEMLVTKGLDTSYKMMLRVLLDRKALGNGLKIPRLAEAL